MDAPPRFTKILLYPMHFCGALKVPQSVAEAEANAETKAKANADAVKDADA